MAVTAPQAVIALHPLGIDRRFELDPLRDDETLAEYLHRIGVPAGLPLTLRLAGRRVPRELWRHTRPKHGQLIEVQAVVQGSGGGQKVIGALLVGLSFIPGLNFFAAGLFRAGTGLIATGFLTSASGFLAGRKRISSARAPEVSPTYSIAGTQNRARPYEPLPVVLGQHRFVPDFAAQPFIEYENDEQYYCAIYHFGVLGGPVDVTELRLGTTLLSAFPDAQIQWSDGFGRVTLVPSNVDTLPGGTLQPGNPWGPYIARQSPVDTVALVIDLEGLLFKAATDIQPLSVAFEAEYRALPSGAWQPFFSTGTTQATSYWSEGFLQGAEWVQIGISNDLAANAYIEGQASGNTFVPNGDSGGLPIPLVWSYRTVSEAQINGWPLPLLTIQTGATNTLNITNGSTKPVRRSYRRDLPVGQYELRIRRSPLNAAPNDTDQWSVTAVRAIQTDDADYIGQLRLALRIRANAQAQGTIDALNAIVTRRTWADIAGTWSVEPTKNPAWLLLAVLSGIRRTTDQRQMFGLGLTQDRIDFDSLRAWAAWCDAKGYECSLVIDREISNRELVEIICTAGFASPQWMGEKFGVVFDAEAQPVSAVVAMPNILSGSFRVDYNTASAPDEVVATFLNEENDWQQEEVRVILPGVTSPRKIERIELMGITKQAHAAAFANLRAAAYTYRRKTITWAMDIEGTLIRRGDVVAFSHDLTQWGYSGRIVSMSGASVGSQIVLDRRVPANMLAVNDEWIAVRVPGELGLRVLRVQCVPQGADNDNDLVTLVDAWPSGVPLPGATRPAIDYVWLYDFRSTPGARYKVIETVPQQRSDGSISVQFTAVPEVPEYYAAAGGTFTPVVPPTLLENIPELSGVSISVNKAIVGGLQAYEVTLAWSQNLSTQTVQIRGQTGSRQTEGGNINEAFVVTAPANQRRYTWAAQIGETWSAILTPANGVGQFGAPVQTGEVTVDAVPPALPDTFSVIVASNGTRVYAWDYSTTARPADLKGVRIRYGLGTGLTWDQMAPLDSDGGFFTVAPAQSLFPGASGTYTFALKAEDQSGNLSTGTRTAQLTITIGGLLDDTNPYGFKSLFQNRYTGASTVTLADNGKAHVKEDATTVTLPNTLPAELLTTVINDNASSWLRVEFSGAVAVVQGRSDTAGATAWELAPRNLLSVTKLRDGVWLISGRVRSA